MSSAIIKAEPSPIRACTISRDVQNFDLLIDDMEAILDEAWGDLGFDDALAFFEQPDAETLEFVAIALDDQDAEDLAGITAVIASAKAKGIKTILVAEDLSTATLHHLLRNGADEFIPYPLPEKELENVVERLMTPEPETPAVPSEHRNRLAATGDRNGVIFPVHGLAGGVGSTTFAVNLAWELANMAAEEQPRVCLLDFDLQYGSVATYLDLPRRDSVLEILQDTESMDNDVFMQALLSYNDKLHVLTPPSDIVPLDLVDSTDIGRILSAAQANFDYVVVDMPKTLVQWTETVLMEAHIYFAVMDLDMRSAQNALRLKKALQAEELPFEKLRFAINRAPGALDMTGRSRIKRLSESLSISINILLPDGGKTVAQAGDHGIPLLEASPKNPLRKEILKLADSLFDLNESDVEAA